MDSDVEVLVEAVREADLERARLAEVFQSSLAGHTTASAGITSTKALSTPSAPKVTSRRAKCA